MSVQFNQIQSFLVIAEKGSFASAAEQLYVSSSALIQQINTLEKSVGFTLFARSNKGVYLTESGAIFYERIKILLREYESILLECKQLAKTEKILRIGVFRNWHYAFLDFNLYTAFLEIYEDVTIEYVYTTQETMIEDCRQGKFDLCICARSNDHKKALQGISFTEISTEEMVVVMGKTCDLIEHKSIPAELLKDHKVMLEKQFSSWEVDDWLRSKEITKVEKLDLDLSSIYRLCKEGAIIIAPNRRKDIVNPLYVRPLESRLEAKLWVLSRANKSQLQEKFIEYVRKFKNNTGEGV